MSSGRRAVRLSSSISATSASPATIPKAVPPPAIFIRFGLVGRLGTGRLDHRDAPAARGRLDPLAGAGPGQAVDGGVVLLLDIAVAALQLAQGDAVGGVSSSVSFTRSSRSSVSARCSCSIEMRVSIS